MRVKAMSEAAEAAEERFYSIKEEHSRSLARLDEVEVQLRAASFAARAPTGRRQPAISDLSRARSNRDPPRESFSPSSRNVGRGEVASCGAVSCQRWERWRPRRIGGCGVMGVGGCASADPSLARVRISVII